MNLIKISLLMFILSQPLKSKIHNKQVSQRITGLLFLQPERNDSNFDLFLKCSLDSSKNLETNIHNLTKGTAMHIDVLNSKNYWNLVLQSHKLRNQSVPNDFAYDLKYVLVVPINAIFDSEKFEKLGQESKIYSFGVSLFDNTLFDHYDSKIVFLSDYSIIDLRKK